MANQQKTKSIAIYGHDELTDFYKQCKGIILKGGVEQSEAQG